MYFSKLGAGIHYNWLKDRVVMHMVDNEHEIAEEYKMELVSEGVYYDRIAYWIYVMTALTLIAFIAFLASIRRR